jgi:membrane-bound metal-dependent hydrolase YbcI (DUF457 family)
VEPLLHFTVPFVALMLAKVEFRKALAISLFALSPDLDALFLVHRSISHSLVVLLMVAVPFLLLAYRFKTRLQSYTYLTLASVASHSVLDVFAGYTPILWPLYAHSVWIKTQLAVRFGSSPNVLQNAQLLVEPTTFQPFQSLDAPLLTGEGLILSVVLLLPVLLSFSKVGWQQIKELATR